ncbi:Protein F19G12.2 [Aphelenchoides avenae]|nr:Protein F19G12.2 [Aphelenchus avenae]
MCIREEKADGDLAVPAAAAKVAPIQGRRFNANSLYPYKAYLDTELSYSSEVKRSYLSASGWFENETGSQADADDPGFKARQKLFAEGKVVQLVAPLHADLFQQPRYLANNSELSIEIHPETSDFALQCLDAGNTKKYKLVITACKLYVKTVTLMDGLALSLAQMLEKMPARYPLRKAELKSENISAGRMQFDTTLFTETVPRRIIVCFLPTANYEGSLATSPFDFANMDIREVSVSANGVSYPNVPYDLEWTDASRFTRAYHDMVEAVGLANSADSNGISLEKFRSGWPIFVFNTSCSQEPNDQSFDLLKSGTVMIHVKFKTAVPAGGCYMVVYGESDSLMMIDAARTVTTDLTV